MVSSLFVIFVGLLAGTNAGWWDISDLTSKITNEVNKVTDKVNDIANGATGQFNDLSNQVNDIANGASGQFNDLTNKVNDLANGQLADLSSKVNDIAGNIPGLSELKNLPAILSDFELKSLTPKCDFKNNIASCCTGLSQVIPTQLCANFLISYNELSVIASVSYNNETLFQKRLEVGQICVPVPGVPMLSVCLQFYWVEVGLGDSPTDIQANFCFQGSATAYATIDFHCLRFEDGRFSLNSDHKPASPGIYNYDVKK